MTWDSSTIVDSEPLYEVTIRLDDNNPNVILPADSATVNVTPRRLQRFSIRNGRRYTWTNTDMESGGIIQMGEIQGDSSGLATIEDFIVKTSGNRLTIVRRDPSIWLEPQTF